MTDSVVLAVLTDALVVAAKLSAPVLLTALVVGFAVSLGQSVTQMQEMTIAFVPKAIAVGIALLVSGSWMLRTLTDFTRDLYLAIPGFLSAG